MTAVECLKKQLNVWISARDHATKSMQKGTISMEQFHIYEENLKPKISEYRRAITILLKNGFNER